MTATAPIGATKKRAKPILLFNDECGMCRRIARWVGRAGRLPSGDAGIDERPIGNDPDALRSLNANLDIWDAYATIHLLMPDGSMKLGGEAVAEVLRSLPSTRWFAWSFAVSLWGFRPFQRLLDLGYAILADVRPLFGCESCGTPGAGVRAIRWVFKRGGGRFRGRREPIGARHFTSFAAAGRPQAAAADLVK
jgi:predicted DCC family thiol-disulfide oxidoreductase YuxK